ANRTLGCSPPEEREDPARPKDAAEDARRTKHPSRLRAQAFEARLHHREHGFGQRAGSPFRDRATQLLEEDRIALRKRRDAIALGVGRGPEHARTELLTGAPRERPERNLARALRARDLGEEPTRFGTRERDEKERRVLERPERAREKPNAGAVAPMR